ncbi:hypothetical protein LEP1GSC038_2258 [Leptospira weilii str. 2006001855]|uniref:Uncharacterized protein n=1 Tax=Leptospira weilii str. 2006001855 TaxID=996804 RepID=M6FMF8_9LEPT|nr:hypothetical protein LEP1GSC051_1986 [Leptospira sp. P2653]EMM73963.1 hypothetical protein LEP1GSC038_2258 [Leptospira weilii str. 2006001855]
MKNSDCSESFVSRNSVIVDAKKVTISDPSLIVERVFNLKLRFDRNYYSDA